ncbi:MAG: MBL fold metallo-hydrolase [Parvibaculales bacterium]
MAEQNYFKFWGTRGSLPVSGEMHTKYGGNSSCVEIRHNGKCLVMDGGSGLRFLGESLVEEGVRQIDVFISHFHNDHICGIPFFAPLFDPEAEVRFHAVNNDDGISFEQALATYMSPPTYPVGMEIFAARVSFNELPSGTQLAVDDVHVTNHPIPHPGGCHAYRFDMGGTSLVYATDTEHVPGDLNQDLAAFCNQADYLLYDCTYDDEGFAEKTGYGHSTWQEGVRLCAAGNVKNLAIMHHAPELTDAQLDLRAEKAVCLFEKAFVAADFQKIPLIHRPTV